MRLRIDPRVAPSKIRDPLWRRECYFFYLPLPAPFTSNCYRHLLPLPFSNERLWCKRLFNGPFFNKPLCIGPLFSNPTLHCFFSSLLIRCGRNDCAYLGSNREPWRLAAFKCTRSDGRYHDWRLSLKVCPCARTTSHSSRYRGPRRAASR